MNAGCAQPIDTAPCDASPCDYSDIKCQVDGPALQWAGKETPPEFSCSPDKSPSQITNAPWLVLSAIEVKAGTVVCAYLYSCGSHATTVHSMTPGVGATTGDWELVEGIAANTQLPAPGLKDVSHRSYATGFHTYTPSPSPSNRICARLHVDGIVDLPTSLTVTIHSDDCEHPVSAVEFRNSKKHPTSNKK